MAKSSPDRHENESPTLLADDVGSVAVQPGPDETPADESDVLGDPPDPAVFLVPEPAKLTKGQIEGLQREGIEAYLFGERVRHDAAGRRWTFRREVVGAYWALAIRVQIGPALLAKSGMTLDRVPSAEGEHQLLQLIEGVAEAADARQVELRSEQQKAIKAAEKAEKAEKDTAKHEEREPDRRRL